MCQTESNGLNLFSLIKVKLEQSMLHLFIYSSNSHFFNQIHFEQYLFESVGITQLYYNERFDLKKNSEI